MRSLEHGVDERDHRGAHDAGQRRHRSRHRTGRNHTVLPDGEIGSLPFLGLRWVGGAGQGAQPKERKGSHFAA